MSVYAEQRQLMYSPELVFEHELLGLLRCHECCYLTRDEYMCSGELLIIQPIKK